jgi:hypothetical protein
MQLQCSRGVAHILAVVCAALAWSAPQARAATPQQINDAIARGVKFLYGTQQVDNWEAGPPDAQGLTANGGFSEASAYGGRTAICTYALLAAGEKPKESPKLAAAIKWLMKADLRGTYAVALRSQVWNLIDDSPERDKARDADARFLLDSLIQKGPGTGFYGYSYGIFGQKPRNPRPFGEGGPGADNEYDRSNSQYGVLGVWALEQAGAEIPQKYWEIVDKAWRNAQQHDGGWLYSDGGDDFANARPTMTCAGVATLFITQDYLLRSKKWDACTGGVIDINIENGMVNVDKHIHELIGATTFYGAYGVERIATASGRRYFGSVDWFQLGADDELKRQNPDAGFWDGQYGGSVPETCFALLFLSRGHAPLMFDKLQYNSAAKPGAREGSQEQDPWNERPRDVANLARWMGPRMETVLNWQSVNLSVTPEELHDAPILYISGNSELKFSDADVDKLRTFVEQGGTILGTADCGAMLFSRSFQKLGNQMFKKYEFRPLPASHLLFSEQYHSSKWKIHPRLLGLSNGVRELMILIPDGDPGRVWQMDDVKRRPEFFELGANIFLYATDRKNLHFRGDPYVVLPDKSTPARTLKIARIQTDGNWDPEPGGWTRLAAIFHNTRGTELTVEPVTLGAGKLASYQIAHLTGTGKLILSADARKELKDFVARGGTLVVDAAGGSAEFATSAEIELKTVFDAAAASLSAPLPMDAPVFSAGEKIDAIGYREFATHSITGALRTPRLCGIPAGNRIGVFYSREDLSAGLVGENIDGIVGYDPVSATRLMSNIISYAGHIPAATTRPAATTKPGIFTDTPGAATKPAK